MRSGVSTSTVMLLVALAGLAACGSSKNSSAPGTSTSLASTTVVASSTTTATTTPTSTTTSRPLTPTTVLSATLHPLPVVPVTTPSNYCDVGVAWSGGRDSTGLAHFTARISSDDPVGSVQLTFREPDDGQSLTWVGETDGSGALTISSQVGGQMTGRVDTFVKISGPRFVQCSSSTVVPS